MKRFAGLLLLAAAIAVAIYYAKRHGTSISPGTPAAPATPAERITVKGLVGGEKSGFLADDEVRKILADKYGIVVDGNKRGSIEMVTGDVAGNDFLWPSSQFAAELFISRQSGHAPKSETI